MGLSRLFMYSFPFLSKFPLTFCYTQAEDVEDFFSPVPLKLQRAPADLCAEQNS